VVEDDLPLRLLVCNLLQRCGYSVLQAQSGAAAVKIWQEQREQIQLLFTDLVMPDGMTGRQLAERLQSDKPSLKVIYTSGYSTEVGKGLSLIEGVNFLQKPYPSGKLARTVRECLDRE
jgi:two-component system cell cycle sensor histidine kinase/response regulator CckA